MADIQATAGTTLGIVASLPATFDAAGYGALTYAMVGEITDLGEFGRVYEEIKHNPIGTRGTRKLLGSYDEQTLSLKLAIKVDDPGQIVLNAQLGVNTDSSIKITDPEGNAYFMPVKIGSFKRAFGTVNNIINATVSLHISTAANGTGIVFDPA